MAAALPHAPRYLLKQAVGWGRPEPGVAEALLAAAPPPEDRLPDARLGLMGDLMWVGGRRLVAGPSVRGLFGRLDGLLANLETPLVAGARVPRLLPDHRTYNEDASLVDVLGELGAPILALSVANNHALDRGAAGLRATVTALARRGLPAVGIDGDPPAVCSAGGLPVAVAGLCWGLNHPVLPAPVTVLPGLARARGVLDVQLGPAAALLAAMPAGALRVLVVHWGHEFEAWPSAAQVEVGRALVELGADLVLGSHPHVVQPAAVFPRSGGGAGLVLFSLGNALSVMVGAGVQLGALAEVGVFAPDRPGGRPSVALIGAHALRSRRGPGAVAWEIEPRPPWEPRLAARPSPR